MEDSDSDYMHAKRVCKDSKVKILGGYHDLYLKSDALFLTDVFENLSIKVFKISLKIYHLDPVKFLSHSLILLFQKYQAKFNALFCYENSKQKNKRERHQIEFNQSSNIDLQDFMNLCKKCTAKPYSFLVIDTTLSSDNSLRFRKNLFEKI